MATLRNTAISLLRLAGATNIAASLRHHAARADRPITLLLTSCTPGQKSSHSQGSNSGSPGGRWPVQ